ncbi:MAG TPA: SdrD B-like domain-containing protein [Candidatus Krumholzibacteria bacterium]|nr:SdrD B-like domain-containing protein [Candidatus Krumholzibacteria bacterium]
MKRIHEHRGFTLVEIAIGIALLGLVLLAFAGMTNVIQKSAGKTRQYTDAQQNARAALDLMTSQLRAAGSDVAAYEGQGTIVFAGPEQVAFNADIDAGKVINGEQPMTAIDHSKANNTVPPSGTAIYAPTKTYNSGAETIVFTLDSDGSGVVDAADQGDDDVEQGHNTHLYLLKEDRYGAVAGANEERSSDVALVRGPVPYDNGDNPPPLFEYFYDDDNDLTTPDVLWGDTDGNGVLNSAEIDNLTDMPADKLGAIRLIKINVVAEGTSITNKDNQGFARVVMSSRVYIRNADSHDTAQIYGQVFYDANNNQKMDSGESGIPNVVVSVSPLGRKTKTDSFGKYNIPVNGGTYTVVETDRSGYSSTTSNSVNVTVADGELKNVDFGDRSGSKSGNIVGTVWDDVNKNAVNDGEQGIPDVVIQLSNGMAGKTNANGYYRITAPVGSYTVSETDPTGYSSTTANNFAATLVNDGDSVVVNFGDAVGGNQGTLQGYVYIDSDQNGVKGGGEAGISGVTLTLSNGATATTDNAGFYQFSLDPGKYDMYELDLDGYTSTTPNIIYNIAIDTGKTVAQDFGDILLKDISFVEIAVGNTDRPLSLAVGDMKEDGNNDPDIVLGTPTSKSANLFFYLNNYVDSSTPLGSLFNKIPSYSHKAVTDVNAVRWMDRNADGYLDVVSGQEIFTGNNVLEWYNNPKFHDVGNAPDQTITSGSSASATRLRLADVNGDGLRDLIIGHKSQLAPFAGGFEVEVQLAPGSFVSQQVVTTNGKGTTLGVVSGLAVGDLDGDGDQDLVVASNDGPYWGHVDIFLNDGDGNYTWQKRLLAKAGVNDVAVADMYNDGYGLPDILVGISEAQNVGGVQVWLNKGGVYGVDDNSGYTYEADTDAKVPDHYYKVGGEALAVAAAHLDADIYPDIIIGTRSSLFYTGDLFVIQEAGTKNEKMSNVKVNVAGEVVTIEVADMNKDGYKDVVVTTRTSANAGKLAIYFLNNLAVVP